MRLLDLSLFTQIWETCMHQTRVPHVIAPCALHPTMVISRCAFFLSCVCKKYWLSLHLPRALPDFIWFPHAVMVSFFSKKEIQLDNKNFSNFCAACLYDGHSKGSWAWEGVVFLWQLVDILTPSPSLCLCHRPSIRFSPSWPLIGCPVGFASLALSWCPCWTEHSQEHPDRNPGLKSKSEARQRYRCSPCQCLLPRLLS